MLTDKVEMKFEDLFLRINPKQFHFLKFILEGYDGLAVLSSYDIKIGLVVLRYPKEKRKDVTVLISSLSTQLTPYPRILDSTLTTWLTTF